MNTLVIKLLKTLNIIDELPCMNRSKYIILYSYKINTLNSEQYTHINLLVYIVTQ